MKIECEHCHAENEVPSPRVSFGQGETQDVPMEWAQDMLTWIREHHGQVFIGAISHAAAGLAVERTSRKKRTVEG